jgi:lysozyme
VDILDQLLRDEGVRYVLYKDTLGIDTFGAGFTFPVDDDEIRFILQHRVNKCEATLLTFPWYTALDVVRRGAVLNMAYNLGLHGLLGFPHMIAALAKQDWETAAIEMQTSLWASQVGPRAQRLEQQIRLGAWV